MFATNIDNGASAIDALTDAYIDYWTCSIHGTCSDAAKRRLDAIKAAVADSLGSDRALGLTDVARVRAAKHIDRITSSPSI